MQTEYVVQFARIRALSAGGIPDILAVAPVARSIERASNPLPQFQAEMAEYGDFHFMPLPQLDDSLHFYDINHLNQDGVDIFCRAFRDSVIIPKLNSLE